MEEEVDIKKYIDQCISKLEERLTTKVSKYDFADLSKRFTKL